MMLRNETYNAMLSPPLLCYFLPAMLFPPRYAIPSPLCFFLPAMLFPSCYAIPLCYAISSHYTLCRCYSHIITTSQYGYFVMSYTKTSQYIRNFSIVNSRKPPLKSYDHYKVPYRVGMITQISHALRIVEPSVTDRIEGISVAAASSGNRLGPVPPTGQHRLEFSPSVEPRPPHTTKPVLRSIPHPDSPFFGRAQTPRVPQSAPYAWDETSAKSANAAQKPFGTAQRSGVERTSKGGLLLPLEPSCVTIGTLVEVAPPLFMDNVTNAPVVERGITGLKIVLEHRRKNPLTPYKFKAWDRLLRQHNLLTKYPKLVASLQNGFDAGIRRFYRTFTPPNGPSLDTLTDIYQEIVDRELHTGHYIGPLSRDEVERLIGPFQSSPLSLVPKPGKAARFRAVHNFSYPHSPTGQFLSVNYTINPDVYPCTWGTFGTVCFTIHNLPPGSQASIRDVAEAYRTIPIIPEQWPGLVVKLRGQDKYCINTNDNFGLASAGGVYGEIADAGADIFRAQGIGPLSKWVDDHIFFRIPCEYIDSYNAKRSRWSAIIAENGGQSQSGSRLWYHGETMPDDLPAEFDEDASCIIKNCNSYSIRSNVDSNFSYCDADIDILSEQLGIPWESSKTIPFSDVVPFLGFRWDLSNKTVEITEEKKDKYKDAIKDWLSRPAHTLDDVQKLYGKLLHASLVATAGRAYLTNLEAMLGTFFKSPFASHHPPRNTNDDLLWWISTLSSQKLSRRIPGPCDVEDYGAFSDASSGVGIAIVIANRWRAWRLIPGWDTEGRDIGWAEAIGFEFLVLAVLAFSQPGQHFRLFGDNRGVVEGWWKGRSRNRQTNVVFRRVHDILSAHKCTIITRYVTSKENPADAPSRGVYPPHSLLLPRIPIPDALQYLVADFDSQPSSHELELRALGPQPRPHQKPKRDFEHSAQHHESDPPFTHQLSQFGPSYPAP